MSEPGTFRYDTKLMIVNSLLALPWRRLRHAVLVRTLGWRIGEDVVIARGMRLLELAPPVVVGDRVNIGRHARFDVRGGIVIGDDVDMAERVTLLTADHDPDAPGHDFRRRGVTIGDRCWIATGATVLPGTKVANGVTLAAMAVGHGVLEERGIYAGNPAKLIRLRAEGAQQRMRPYRRFWQ